MAGRRPLTLHEERKLLRTLRRMPARDAALVTAQLMSGFRVSEILSLTIAQVWRAGVVLPRLAIAPRNMKGGYGRTRTVPILPTLRRALERHLHVLSRRYELTPDLPLFLSRQSEPNGSARALSREQAHRIVHRAFRRAGITDDGRLGTHSLRKTWARATYLACNRDIHVLRAALNHSSVTVSERYLEVDSDELERAMHAIDRRRAPRPPKAEIVSLPVSQAALARPA